MCHKTILFIQKEKSPTVILTVTLSSVLIIHFVCLKIRQKSVLKCIFSSPEHKVLRGNYCNRTMSIVNFLPCVLSRGHIFRPIVMKLGQNVCLDEISDKFEIGSCGVKN